MGKWLYSRWCGISGYAMVMALLMGTLTWWLLPRYGHQHRWTLDGSANVQWIGKDGDIVVKVHRPEPHKTKVNSLTLKPMGYQLQTSDGSVKQIDLKEDFSKPDFIEVGMKLQRRRNLKNMSDDGPLELQDRSRQVVEVLPITERILGDHGRTEFLIFPQEVKTAGEFAMSTDQRWLLMQHRYTPPWASLRDWITPRWPALANLLPTDNTFEVLLYDRNVMEVIRLYPCANHMLQFIFDREGNRGFLVVDRPNMSGMPRFPLGCQSTLTWYSLPLQAPPWKWYLALGVACLPLVLSWLRRRRGVRLPVATVPTSVVPS